jgi:hypothetical protein
MRLFGIRDRIDEVTLALLDGVGSDRADPSLLPVVAQDISVRLAVELAVRVAGRRSPRTESPSVSMWR